MKKERERKGRIELSLFLFSSFSVCLGCVLLPLLRYSAFRLLRKNGKCRSMFQGALHLTLASLAWITGIVFIYSPSDKAFLYIFVILSIVHGVSKKGKERKKNRKKKERKGKKRKRF
jgi:hypothetical protein